MPVSVDTLRLQLDYSAWASQRMMDVAAKLSEEELTRDFKTADKTVLDTLVHIYAADRIWLTRVLGEPRATFIDPQDRDLTLLQTEWPALHQRWKLWLRDFNDDDVLRVIDFKDIKGRAYSSARVADSSARGESRHASPRADFGLSARHGSDAAAAGFDGVLSGHHLMQPSGAHICPKCSGEVRDGWRVCPACLAPLAAGADTKTEHMAAGASPSSSSSSLEEGRFPAGTVLAGRYRILGLLGHGGMGEVYRAYDLILNQAVALKFLAAPQISEPGLARFRNEVRIARQVSHPNVCRVYDIGFIDGFHFLSMEYLDGEDLDSLLRRIGRLPQDKAIEFARKICAGLAAAHERGVLHRDLKPANIMIDGRGQVRIADFGLAALAAEIPLSDLRSGTPAFMSPEQKAGKEVTTRSDLYSLGLVLV